MRGQDNRRPAGAFAPDVPRETVTGKRDHPRHRLHRDSGPSHERSSAPADHADRLGAGVRRLAKIVEWADL